MFDSLVKSNLIRCKQSNKVCLGNIILKNDYGMSNMHADNLLISSFVGFHSMPPDHRKQIDNLKKFSVDFRVSV